MKRLLTLSLLFVSYLSYAQPIGTPSASIQWRRGGNNAGPTASNIFGTMWNSSIFTYTNGTGRLRLNGDLNYTVNGLPGIRNGFMYLTNRPNAQSWGTGLRPYTEPNFGAFSLLHLNGDDSPNIQEGGYRNWMRNGLLFTNNFDMGFVGVRRMPNTTSPGSDDVSDFVINWSDNVGVNPLLRGPDNLVFNFTTSDGVGGSDLLGSSLYGRETMRHTSGGNIGIGPRFDNNNQPKSTLHQHQENAASSWIQITNQTLTTPGNQTGPTQILANNGFRIGLLGHANQSPNGNALVYQQENKHLLFSTNANTTNVTAFNTLERMRVSSIGAETELASGAYGVYNPSGLPGNLTRVSISHNPSNPVTRPLSLLHLGYNTGAVGGGTEDGWRDWMDIGSFTSNGTDNVYIGLKEEPGILGDRHDAIVSWGDNDGSTFFNGPDQLRFIFTSTQTGAGNSPADSNDGLEVGRFSPASASTLANFGMMGIGHWPAPTYAGGAIDAKLDIDGDLRIREVTQDDNLTQVLVRDPSDGGRVHWTEIEDGLACWDLDGDGIQDPNEDINGDGLFDALDCQGVQGIQGPQGPVGPQGPAGSTTLAHNGTSMSTIIPTNVALGQDLNDPNNPGILLSHREIPMNNRNIHFTGQPTGNNQGYRLIVGDGTGGQAGKLHVNTVHSNTSVSAITGSMDGSGSATTTYGLFGISKDGLGESVGVRAVGRNGGVTSHGLIADASGTAENVAVFGQAHSGVGPVGTEHVGIHLRVEDANVTNVGAKVRLKNPNASGPCVGVSSVVREGGLEAYGGLFIAGGSQSGSTLTDVTYGIYAESEGGATNPLNNYAGWFQGNLHTQGNITASGTITPSDNMFKTNMADLTGSMALINQLSPRTFEYDTANFADFNFDGDQQMGLIAQEVEQVIPTIVSNHIRPAQYDSLGNQTLPELAYKGVEYEELIPLLISGMQEQQAEIDTKDSLIEDLNDRLTELENCLSNLLPTLCNANAMAVEDTPEQTQQRLSRIMDIELADGKNISLSQNVPNPFAERTVITWAIPATVQQAQILFYDGEGALIKTVDIDERGSGQINVFANDLSSGIYVYTLVADGKIVMSKRMVKQ